MGTRELNLNPEDLSWLMEKIAEVSLKEITLEKLFKQVEEAAGGNEKKLFGLLNSCHNILYQKIFEIKSEEMDRPEDQNEKETKIREEINEEAKLKEEVKLTNGCKREIDSKTPGPETIENLQRQIKRLFELLL